MSVAEQTQREQGGTVELDAQMWKKAVHLVEAVARLKMTDPEIVKRIAPATALAMDRANITYEGDGVYRVKGTQGSSQVEAKRCTCDDFVHGKAPSGLCKHRLSVTMLRRASKLTPHHLTLTPEQLVAELEQGEAPPPGPPPAVDEAAPSGKLQVPKHFLEYLQGKPFIKYVGLLQLAQARGLVELRAKWTHNDAELSLAHAVAIFEDGHRFEESGDSTPQNAKNIGLAWRRMALTRAKARALRDSLGIDMVSVEEMD
jgi:hypothetical protein